MTTVPQHLQALAHANEVRAKRRALKADIAACLTTVPNVLAGIPDYAATMAIIDLLMAQRYFARQRCRKLLAVAQVGELEQLADLTDEQRRVISDLVSWGRA